MDEIALEVAHKAMNEWGKPEGELLYLKRAPKPLYERWKKLGELPRNIDREVVEIMHRTHIGVDQDYKNLVKQCTRAALADGWGGSMLATEVVKAGGLGNDIRALPAAGSAPEWMSEKAISIGHYFVASGVYTVFGVHMPLDGAPVFRDYMYNELENIYGGMWDCEPDPVKHAHKMIAHIDKKRKELGIDKARERILMDMADRQKLEAI